MSPIKDIALKLGKFMHHHKRLYTVIRVLVFITTVITVGYEVLLTVLYSKGHGNYRSYGDHYLVRAQTIPYRGVTHMNSCCQWFQSLDQQDVDAINSKTFVPDVMLYALLIVGCLIFLVWGNFVQLKGRYGMHSAVSVCGMLLGLFSLKKTVVKYGNECIECAHLNWLLVKPQFYPHLGFAVFILAMIDFFIYFKCLRGKKNTPLYTLWVLLVFVTVVVWAWCHIMIIINSPLGWILFVNTIMDFLLLSEAYYSYDKKFYNKGPDKAKIQFKNFFEFINPF